MRTPPASAVILFVASKGNCMSPAERSANVVAFDVFQVDLRAGELYKAGRKIKLQDQPFQALAMLLERPCEVVTRDEFRKRLWPEDTFVDFEHSLNTAIKKLRQALGDDKKEPRFVETLPKRGYRFLVSVKKPPTTNAAAELPVAAPAAGAAKNAAASPWVGRVAKVCCEAGH